MGPAEEPGGGNRPTSAYGAPPAPPTAFGSDASPLLTVQDLARVLGVTPRGARLVLERGELPGFRIGRRWYVRAQDLDRAIGEKVTSHSRDRAAAVRILRGVPGAQRAKESP